MLFVQADSKTSSKKFIAINIVEISKGFIR